MTHTVAKLEAAGGRRWTKGQYDRVYFNNLPERVGLEVGYYGTGNVRWAKLDGERISNSHARHILGTLRFSKLYYDLTSGEWCSEGLHDDQREAIVTRLESELVATDV